MLEVKSEDIDRENKRLRLVNSLEEDEHGSPLKFTERYIDVNYQALKLIDGAITSTAYEKSNGDMKTMANKRSYNDLVKNDYVVRASITQTE